MNIMEGMGCKDYTQIIIKGKRTKRQRPSSPLDLTMGSCSSSATEGGNGGGSGGGGDGSQNSGGGFDCFSISPTNSIKFTNNTEEEDMANCLILLAQGQTQKLSSPVPVAATASKAGGLYAYQCKTCNRCFSSFQALGGHRASHKKAKATIEEKNPEDQFPNDNTAVSLQIPNRALSSINKCYKSRVHECSICGAEFTSGQALGGHMRRHRTMSMATTTSNNLHEEAKRPTRDILSLDLNLPAPEDHHDHRESKIVPFTSKGQVIVFSASPLIDCHY